MRGHRHFIAEPFRQRELIRRVNGGNRVRLKIASIPDMLSVFQTSGPVPEEFSGETITY
jgi:hypothetical protein